MNNKEALAVLQSALDEYRHRSYGELEVWIGKDCCLQVVGPSGTEYQLEIQVLWEQAPRGNILVVGSVDDGGVRALFPLCESFVVKASCVSG